MMNIFIAGFQHETNTFAPSLADWAAFQSGSTFPAVNHGAAMVEKFKGVNIPIGGFIRHAYSKGWTLTPSLWAGATPSSYVTEDAFEQIATRICNDLQAAWDKASQGDAPVSAVYLDLHGAAVAQHVDDTEGELLARVRAIVGADTPIVASLDLHANVTAQMLALADGLVSYRTYPHIDMGNTGTLAAKLLERRMALRRKEALYWRRLPFLIPLNAQSTWLEPAKSQYESLIADDKKFGTIGSFCMGFPAADIAECGAVVWSYGKRAFEATDLLYQRANQPKIWEVALPEADAAVEQALALAEQSSKPIIIADTQDNPGAGGDSNTTGMLHALLSADTGKRYPLQVALGLMFDPVAAKAAHSAVQAQGLGSEVALPLGLGLSVPTWGGQVSDSPVMGKFIVRAISDGHITLTGPMMTNATFHLGPTACLEIEGVLVVVVSAKKQMLDRGLFQIVGIEPSEMKILVVKSSNHFRADFTPLVADPSHIIYGKAAGPMAADPADLPWKKYHFVK
jgi:microcystin degradation protein MlrC